MFELSKEEDRYQSTQVSPPTVSPIAAFYWDATFKWPHHTRFHLEAVVQLKGDIHQYEHNL